ncbi:SinI family autotransporter-associated protein [Superficieibacter sp. HKU1]|uniref:SinI family autotransporter-associated protein n=1 Tax=Superficieibacter sp. HKU1 TaxID=3031919 RepID=UPI0023E1419D|nr:SinI family autotransporter-associated protein [Superficieibacter sp. HKU1]WES67078.1 SinI family autotransporter-associated protein [Superficieibacter sp. HKU1]
MQSTLTRRLTKVALALVLAGYCTVPAAMADETRGNLKEGQWQVSGTTGTIQGTVPWINRLPASTTEADKNHVTVTIDRSGRPGGSTVTTDGDKQLHIGDKLTVTWGVGDEQGDVDATNETKKTIQWMSYTDQDGNGETEIGTKGSETYTIKAADADKYIGLKITATTTTGDPRVAEEIILKDLSTDAGGGSDSDDIPEGPVVDDNVNVIIVDMADQSVNLLKKPDAKLHTGHSYKVVLWKDTNDNDTYDTGVDTNVTNNYDYQWVFTGHSATDTTAPAGPVDSSVQNQDLQIPETNAEASSVLPGAGADGVQGYGLSVKYKRK